MTDQYRTVLDALHAHGKIVRERGDTATAQCPAHPDRSPSLTISRGQSQPVVLSCMAGCDTRAVLHAIGLTEADICADRPKPAPVAQYPYTDEHGELLYTVVRYEPGFDGAAKSFAQRPASGRTGPGAMDGVRRVLYRLPDVLAAVQADKTVWIVEGEKDADRLAHLGQTATCNAGGAGKWRAEYLTHLHGAQVCIIADRDRPGYHHAQQVADMLRHVAGTVEVVEPATGKDASDHLDAGLELGDLVEIDPAERLAQLDTETADDDAPHATGLGAYRIDWAKFWSAENDGADFLCEPFLVAGRGHALYAGAKTGKSLLVLEAAAAIATGRTFMDQPAGPPRTVVYCDYEMTEDDVRERLEKFGYGPTDDLSHLHYISLPSIPPLDTVEGGDVLIEYVAEVDAELVVIDTSGRAVAGEENSADTFRAFYRCTGQRLKQMAVAWVRVDHAGKDKERGQRGSSAKNDDVDYVWELARLTGSTLRLQATHRRSVIGDDTIDLTRHDDGTVPMHQRHHESWGPGTKEAAETLDRLGVPLDATVRDARRMLSEAGEKIGNDPLSSGLKWRRHEAQKAVMEGLIHSQSCSGTRSGTRFPHESGTDLRNTPEQHPNVQVSGPEHVPEHSGTSLESNSGTTPPPIGGCSGGPPPTALDDLPEDIW